MLVSIADVIACANIVMNLTTLGTSYYVFCAVLITLSIFLKITYKDYKQIKKLDDDFDKEQEADVSRDLRVIDEFLLERKIEDL